MIAEPATALAPPEEQCLPNGVSTVGHNGRYYRSAPKDWPLSANFSSSSGSVSALKRTPAQSKPGGRQMKS
ncbi:hypothetical protein [Sphingopyxis sp. 113P3]|uniref:hypothetical protein n=1 Tax=Sphingopyxis sp. (strain 113P3) TaxID=292913 RepID=UPI0006AD56E2|nr:hypothetical protein [Sphingopyxis sp. 113P3]